LTAYLIYLRSVVRSDERLMTPSEVTDNRIIVVCFKALLPNLFQNIQVINTNAFSQKS
jgi:hypothetical protein